MCNFISGRKFSRGRAKPSGGVVQNFEERKIYDQKIYFHIRRHVRKCILFHCQDGATRGAIVPPATCVATPLNFLFMIRLRLRLYLATFFNSTLLKKNNIFICIILARRPSQGQLQAATRRPPQEYQ